MKKILVSGNINLETNVTVEKFPIEYRPVFYPFFGIHSNVGGVAYNVSKALSTLGNQVSLLAMLGNDAEAKQIQETLNQDSINTSYIQTSLKETARSVVLHANDGRRQIYSDLKNLQECTVSFESIDLTSFDLIVACNVNFNRPLLHKAKSTGKPIATDVHVLSNPHDDYNCEFLQHADIIFLSDEGISGSHKDFITYLKTIYPAQVIVIGEGKSGALLYNREDDSIYSFDSVYNSNVVNTLGAGDALFSSFNHYYANGINAIESLKKAEIFASSKISFNGASNGFLTAKEVDDFSASTNISIVKL